MTDLPDGTYVEWRGRTYRGSVSGPSQYVVFADSQEDPEFIPGMVRGWERTVPMTEATGFALASRCRWRGETFWVLSRSRQPARLLLGWDGDPRRAGEIGLTRVDKMAWEVEVPESEVTGMEQVRRAA
ncbi:hypothetical protein TEK04_01145 [Klenkia sp. LSe6-5]|uniref:Uncharacterized protein n=1 Tax=Klenkia sesuvii TaxID=3103137 RepID=A0ABU8DNS4_9ACTN